MDRERSQAVSKPGKTSTNHCCPIMNCNDLASVTCLTESLPMGTQQRLEITGSVPWSQAEADPAGAEHTSCCWAPNPSLKCGLSSTSPYHSLTQYFHSCGPLISPSVPLMKYPDGHPAFYKCSKSTVEITATKFFLINDTSPQGTQKEMID